MGCCFDGCWRLQSPAFPQRPTHFATLRNNPAINMFGFDDLSGNISGPIWGRD
jgi:hypothetical protein